MQKSESNSFIYKNFDEWKEPIRALIHDILCEPVIEALRNNPPKYVVSDEMDWLESVVYDVMDRYIDVIGVLSSRFRNTYSHLRAYHASCPLDLATYYANGILSMNPDLHHTIIRDIFISSRFPELDSDLINRAIADVGTDLREGRAWFTLDDKSLIEFAGHYLLYGSEYLVSIAASLTRLTGGSIDYRQYLKNRGIPTMFICDVPLEMVSSEVTEELAGIFIEYAAKESLGRQVDYRDDFGFEIYETLPPEMILGHYHPTDIADPL